MIHRYLSNIFSHDILLLFSINTHQSVDADYEQVPIEQYGQALLRGMGWTEGMGVGKKGR